MLALLQVSVADEVPHIVTVDEGTNVNSCCDILLPRMPHHPIAAGVLCHLIRNLVHNAETHGGGGEVFMAVAATHVTGDKAVLCVTIVNTAGAGHATTLHLQVSNRYMVPIFCSLRMPLLLDLLLSARTALSWGCGKFLKPVHCWRLP